MNTWRALVTAVVIYACVLQHVSAFQSHQPSYRCCHHDSWMLLQHTTRDAVSSARTSPATTSKLFATLSSKRRTMSASVVGVSPGVSPSTFRQVLAPASRQRAASTSNEEKESNGGIWWFYWYLVESRLFKIMLLPWKLLILRPFRILVEKMIARLAYDDTEDVRAMNPSSKMKTTNTESSSSSTTVVSHPTGHATITKSSTLSDVCPVGDRWAVSAKNVDLSGDWELIVTEEFRKQYDKYLERLCQPKLVRSVAVGIVAQTTEKLLQSDQGRSLLVSGQNIRGTWTRTLIASGTDADHDTFTPLKVPITSADAEQVEAESWWENEGFVHVSWMRGVTKYGGGNFESRRYLENDVYVCESTFYPNGTNKEPTRITWKFRRQGSHS